MKRRTINVTAEDIKKGFKWSDRCCPVARAMIREYGRAVCVSSIYWRFANSKTTHCLPIVATRFISRFDRGDKVKPLSFTIGG